MGAMTFRVCPQRNQASRARVRSTPDVLPPPGATLGEVLLQEQLEEAPISAKVSTWPSLDSEASTERSESSSDRSRRHKQQKAELLSPPPSGCVPKGRQARCDGVEAPEDMDAWHRATSFSEAVNCLATDGANGASVTKLALVGVALTDEEASRLADHLHSNPNVLRLALVECNLGDQAAEHLAEALAANDVLTSLSLEGNRVGDRGAGRLANALHRNEALTSLSLGRNCVGNQGVKQLLDALESNYTLRILDLTSNSVSRPGWSIAGDGRTANQKRLQALLQRNRAPRKVVTLRAQLQSPRSSESELQVGGAQLPQRTDETSLDVLASVPQTLHISCTSMAGTVLTELVLDASKGLRELREELAGRLGLPKPQLALLLPDGRLLKARDHRSLMEIFTCLDSRSDADDPIECSLASTC